MKKKIRFLLPSLLFFLGAPIVWWFCFREVPLSISPETTFLTAPLTADGKRIDYFSAIKEKFEPKVEPERNAFRKVVRALGNSPWFQEGDWIWPELCNALKLDPNRAPTLKYDSPEEFLKRELLFALEKEQIEFRDESTKQGDKESTDTEKLNAKLQISPWTAAEFPYMVRWVEENSPFLDLLAEASREEFFFVPLLRNPLSPEMDRSFVGGIALDPFQQGLLYRMNYRLGLGDLDGAWEDAISFERLHILDEWRTAHSMVLTRQKFPAFPCRLVLQASKSTLSQDQRKKFFADLESLPARVSDPDLVWFDRILWLMIYPDLAENVEIQRFFGIKGKPLLNWNVVAGKTNEYFDQYARDAEKISEESDFSKKMERIDRMASTPLPIPKRSFLGRRLGKPLTVYERSVEAAYVLTYASGSPSFLPFYFKIRTQREQAISKLRKSFEEE